MPRLDTDAQLATQEATYLTALKDAQQKLAAVRAEQHKRALARQRQREAVVGKLAAEARLDGWADTALQQLFAWAALTVAQAGEKAPWCSVQPVSVETKKSPRAVALAGAAEAAD